MTRRVLVVEDDAAVRTLLCRILGLYGYATAESGTGIGAFAHLRLSAPDLVLLDLMLPGGVSGFDVAERMREHPLWRDIPVVPMTASIHLEDRIQRMQPRFVLRKPFSLEDLLEVIAESLPDVATPAARGDAEDSTA